MSVDDVGQRIMARIAETSPELFGREPRWAYFECGVCGAMFLWTTERAGDGKFISAIYRPVGKGARTGTATTFKITREARHRKRKDAKARADRLHDKHTAAHDHDRRGT